MPPQRHAPGPRKGGHLGCRPASTSFARAAVFLRALASSLEQRTAVAHNGLLFVCPMLNGVRDQGLRRPGGLGLERDRRRRRALGGVLSPWVCAAGS